MSGELPPELIPFLDQWLSEEATVEALTGDASVRQYFRICRSADESVVVAYYPEAVREQLSVFLRAFDLLAPRLPVPAVVRACGFAVAQQDVGAETLSAVLARDPERGRALYRKAVELLVILQKLPDEGGRINPPFDASKFRQELEMTVEFYVERLMGERDPARIRALGGIFGGLAGALELHDSVLCHRDYHGDNIHVLSDDLYIIDYQDLRIGPYYYDLGSLLRDRGVVELLGDRFEREMLDHYAQLGGRTANPHQYREVLLQRTIKTIGTFARQAVTRGRDHYLRYIPPALETIRFCLRILPEYREILELFPMQFSPATAARGVEGGTP